jgi:hypothetical protein
MKSAFKVKKSTKRSAKRSTKKSTKKSPKRKSLCKQRLSKQIAENIKEGRFSSKQQAIAVAYSQVQKKYPHCKRYLKKKSE